MVRKGWKAIAVAMVGLAYGIAAIAFPDVMLPDQELVNEILTAIDEYVTSSGE